MKNQKEIINKKSDVPQVEMISLDVGEERRVVFLPITPFTVKFHKINGSVRRCEGDNCPHCKADKPFINCCLFPVVNVDTGEAAIVKAFESNTSKALYTKVQYIIKLNCPKKIYKLKKNDELSFSLLEDPTVEDIKKLPAELQLKETFSRFNPKEYFEKRSYRR